MNIRRVTVIILAAAFLVCHVSLADGKPTMQRSAHQAALARTPARLGVTIEFSGKSGDAVVDESGLAYNCFGYPYTNSSPYAPELWGVYPVYTAGELINARITVTNRSMGKIVEVKLDAERISLVEGAELTYPVTGLDHTMSIPPRCTKTFEVSFLVEVPSDTNSALNRLAIKVFEAHGNEDGSGRSEFWKPIAVRETVYCPQELDETLLAMLDQMLPPPDTIYVGHEYDENTEGWQYDHFDDGTDGYDALSDPERSGTINFSSGSYDVPNVIDVRNRRIVIVPSGLVVWR